MENILILLFLFLALIVIFNLLIKKMVPEEGIAKGAVVNQKEFDIGLDDYYMVRGWTKDGIPTPEKLKEVGLDDLIPIVEKKIASKK